MPSDLTAHWADWRPKNMELAGNTEMQVALKSG